MIEYDKQIRKINIILWVYDIYSEEDRYVKKKKDALSLPEGFEWKRK